MLHGVKGRREDQKRRMIIIGVGSGLKDEKLWSLEAFYLGHSPSACEYFVTLEV